MLIVLSRSGMEEFTSIEREEGKKIDIIMPVSSHTQRFEKLLQLTQNRNMKAEEKKECVYKFFSYNEMRFGLIH